MEEIQKFIEETEEFKKDPRYETMPAHLRDWLNEELGRFKAYLDLHALKKKEDEEKHRENARIWEEFNKMPEEERIKKIREIGGLC